MATKRRRECEACGSGLDEDGQCIFCEGEVQGDEEGDVPSDLMDQIGINE